MPNINHSNPERTDSMIIGSGHSILAGYVPPSISHQEFTERYYEWTKPTEESVKQLGLFGGDINYHTYYPNLSADELKPKESEFIEPVFRLLSETIVSKNYNPVDFGYGGVLKASMKMLLGQTVNCDHETNIGNAIGSVSKVMWQEAYKEGKFTIPAGINGVLKIDGKANPRIARGILMEPPSIHSNSVTVQFKWDKSHPNLSDEEFWEKLGTYDSNGVLICRRATEIIRYLETSLVSHGADNFAQKIGADGKIINPDFANKSWNAFKENDDGLKINGFLRSPANYFFGDSKSQETYSDNNTYPVNNDNTQITFQNMNEELRIFLEEITGEGMLVLGEGMELNTKNVLASFKKVLSLNQENQEKINTLTAEKEELNEKIANLNTQVANLQEFATVGKNHIASLREDVVANYKKLKGEEADETILNMIGNETTGMATLISLNKDYQQQLEEKFPMTCSDCGSHNISRASSAKAKEDITHNTEEDPYLAIYNKKLK